MNLSAKKVILARLYDHRDEYLEMLKK